MYWFDYQLVQVLKDFFLIEYEIFHKDWKTLAKKKNADFSFFFLLFS